jgi:DNA-binding CsgD family transcriptional regulator
MYNMERFWNASLEEMKNGYVEESQHYICLFCGKKTEKGIIYRNGETFYEAEKYIKVHIENDHGSVFEQLIGLDKKITGLSEHQSSLLKLFYQGKSDAEVQKEMGIGSGSTIRNHRFILKEKEKQAKVFLVLMELLKGKDKKATDIVSPHSTARMTDDRYNVTLDDKKKILAKYFTNGLNGPIKTFSMKEKSKLVVLEHIARRFEKGRIYSEKEVNEKLKTIYEDYVTIRRYLIEYGFMDRKQDCSQYWLKEAVDSREEDTLDRRKELIQQYKEMKTEAGVYQIRNTKNQKVLVIATPNLKTMNGRRHELRLGSYKNQQLQEDWNKYGEESFAFEVLEVLKKKEDGYFDEKDELKKLNEKWCQKLQPYGENGYNG